MITYITRRLLLLPITLFFIVLVNFIIINLAPGDPTTVSEITQEGATRQADRSMAFGSDFRYLQFREFYGLTLPIVLNLWPYTSAATVKQILWQLAHRKQSEKAPEMSVKDYDALRISFGDRSRFILPLLLGVIEDPKTDEKTRIMAVKFFIRGGTMQAYLGPNLSDEEKSYNRKVAKENQLLSTLQILPTDTPEDQTKKISALSKWYHENKEYYEFVPSAAKKTGMIFTDTRFFRYMSRVLRLDFGTMRNDANKTVVNEVTRRFKYSLTLSVLPMIMTFFLCQLFGFLMAYFRNRPPDFSLNVLFLVLYAVPIFVVAPFLIEKIALHYTFPFTNAPIPLSGFTSPESIYSKETSLQRLLDIAQHIFLPLLAIMYGSLAAQTRLSRTAVLEVLHQDYVRTARAKGLSTLEILFKHVGRNAGITIVTSIAGSLGVILGGSLIVEILFEIDGFGKFFYDAVVNRDYNVILFSTLAGSFLTLLGYLMADLAYTALDPRVTLE